MCGSWTGRNWFNVRRNWGKLLFFPVHKTFLTLLLLLRVLLFFSPLQMRCSLLLLFFISIPLTAAYSSPGGRQTKLKMKWYLTFNIAGKSSPHPLNLTLARLRNKALKITWANKENDDDVDKRPFSIRLYNLNSKSEWVSNRLCF